jgi:hypothetical protein
MIYIGLGNSGSKILWNHFEFLFDRQAMPEALTRMAHLRFLIGDADTNNSVLYEVGARKLHQATPPLAIHLMGLSRYWTGGCGVYHIIGELLADTMARDPDFRQTLQTLGASSVTLLLSAGGGTGGGVGGFFREYLPANASGNLGMRLFAVLPEMDQFRKGGIEVSGPDGFQCASAGRFLLKFLGHSAWAQYSGAAASTADLFVLSNSYLSAIPPAVSYQDGVKRLNIFLAQALAMMPTLTDFPARRRLTTFGVGSAPRAQPGAPQPQPATELARDLVRTALSPLDLSRNSPSGLSGLPMELSTYTQALTGLLSGAASGNSTVTEPSASLLRVFRKCLAVHANLCYNAQTTTPNDVQAVRRQVNYELVELLGPNVVVNVRDGGPLPGPYLPETEQPGQKADYALLLLLDDLLIEDVYRLVIYFIQSSFPWTGGTVDHIADLVNFVLTDHEATPESMQQALTGGRNLPNNTIKLKPDARECYPERLWGNIEDLKSKVLQSLNRPEQDFDARLLRVPDIANALYFFHQQLWRYA